MTTHTPEYQRERRARIKAEKERKEDVKNLDALFEEFIPSVLNEYQDEGPRYKSEILNDVSLEKLYDTFAKGKKILEETRTFHEWRDLRDKARKDLFWFGTDVLKHNWRKEVHQVVCDQFVKKNFDGAFPCGYSLEDVHKAIARQVRVDCDGIATREMMLLDSRGFFKSTIDRVDILQWLLNCPDIRIFMLTGEKGLARGMRKTVKGYFHLTENGKMSDFHLLFPEYILRGKSGTKATDLWCPVRRHTDQNDPSFFVSSIDSSTSGWHSDISKYDDCVTNRNSKKEEMRKKVKEEIVLSKSILSPWGLFEYIGTRYADDDAYGVRLNPKIDDEFFDADRDSNPIKTFIRGCWTVKSDYQDVPLRQLKLHMVDLTFPDLNGNPEASFAALRSLLLQDETVFKCQQLNLPALTQDEGFTRFNPDLLDARLINSSKIPNNGYRVAVWDWALTASATSDFSACIVARICLMPTGIYNVYVEDVLCEKWNTTELLRMIVEVQVKWNPRTTLIEDSNGSDFLKRSLPQMAANFGVVNDVFAWAKVDKEADAKRNRIKGLQLYLDNQILWFSTSIQKWDETRLQFVRFKPSGKKSGQKDDIPDALALLFKNLYPASIVELTPEQREQEQKEFERKQENEHMKAHIAYMFGSGLTGYEQPPEQQEEQLDPMTRLKRGLGLIR